MTQSALHALAEMLGVRTTRGNGVEVPTDEIQKMAMSAISLLRDRADSSTLATDEVMADCTIRVTVASSERADEEDGTALGHATGKRPAEDEGLLLSRKRVKQGEAASSCGGSSLNSEGINGDASVRVVKAHSQILARASPYFMRSFASGFQETMEKVITIELPGEEAFEDFRRLIELSYRPTYIKDANGQTFGANALVRLMLMADHFEYTTCVKECADALKVDLTYEDADMVLNWPLPEPLLQNASVAELIDRAGDAVAAELGPVADLFGQSRVFARHEIPQPADLLKLGDKAKRLSAAALESALRNEKLSVGSESETWWLLTVWFKHSGLATDKAQELFNRLFPSLRLVHFSYDFIANVVMTSPYVKACPDALRLLAAGIRHRGSVASALLATKRFEPTQAPRNRSMQPGRSVWSLRGAFELAACKELSVSGRIIRVIGLADGFPVHVFLEKRAAEDGRNTLGNFHWVRTPCVDCRGRPANCGYAVQGSHQTRG